MSNLSNYFKKALVCLCSGAGIFYSLSANAEGSPIYYDSFYEDYYKAFPDAKPKKKETKVNVTPQQVAMDPYVQYQTTGFYNQNVMPMASFYQSVEHDPSKWDIEVQMKKTYGQFMFETDVGSVLNWDELDSTETIFKVSRDFMIKNRQYVFTATYGTGSGSTTRTSDDDIYNEAHIISLGSGDVDLSSWSIAFGMRNLWRLGNWDITPYVGYKKKKQEFTMKDHATPFTFALEYFCGFADDGGVVNIDGNVYENVCTSGINLLDHVDESYWQNYMYYIDDNGYEITGETVSSADMTIPGYVANQGVINLMYGDQIYQQDYCYYTDTEAGQSGRRVCISAADNGAALLNAFGGVSSVFIADGITHMYFVDWSGPFVGLNLERKISNREEVTLYAEYFLPHYKVWGNWPNRTDWMHDPSFIDEGGSGLGLLLNLNYKYLIKNNIQFVLGAEYEYLENSNADTTLFFADGTVGFYPASVMKSRWQSYGVNLGLTFKF